jgi:ribonuclease D
MLAALQERGLNELVDEDCKRIIRQTRLQNGNQPDDMLGAWRQVDVWRVKGAQDLEAQQSAVLQELCIYRDQVARAEDRPWFKVIGDATLLEVARRAPQTMDELRRIHGMTTGQVRRHGKGLLEAVRQGLQAPPLYPRRKPRPDEAYLHRLDALRRWRKAAGERMGVGSDVILPRDLMETLADKNPADEPQLREFMDCYPWRLQRFGGEILNAMRKKS